MLITIKFEFLGSLKKDYLCFVPEFFEENGQEFCKTLMLIDSADSTLNLPEMWEAKDGIKGTIGNKIPMPLYLAKKDLAKYVQAAYPQARIQIINDNETN